MATIRLFRHYIPAQLLFLGLIESVIIVFGFTAGVHVRYWQQSFSTPPFLELLPYAVLFSVVVILCMIALGLYEKRPREGLNAMGLRVIGSFALSILPLSMFFYLAPDYSLGRGVITFAMFFSLIGIISMRVVFFEVVDQNVLKRRILVLGAGKRASQIADMETSPELNGVSVVGYVHMRGEQDSLDEGRVIRLQDQSLKDLTVDRSIDEMVVAVDDRRKALPVHEILDCKMDGVDVVDLLTFFERETGKVKLDIMQPSWMFLSDGFQCNASRAYTKRLLDIVVSLLLLPLALPIMIVVAAAILIESRGRGGFLYHQVRAGEKGIPFTIYKFRSMRVDAESDGQVRWAQKKDNRVTRVGSIIRKIRADELPQIFNILNGDMSFVGPRPERPEFVSELEKTIPYYNERHRMKPGLTGWAQISYQYGASEGDALEKLQYDLYYIKNYSVFIDLIIILKTAEVVLVGKGAH